MQMRTRMVRTTTLCYEKITHRSTSGRRPGTAARAAALLSALLVLGATEAVAAPAAPASTVARTAVGHALDQVGKPYRYGAAGPHAFDCSGLVTWAYGRAGRPLPRTTYDQYRRGTPVARANASRGDLVFFYSGPSHVGILLGDGRMVHAPSSGRTVQVVRLADHYQAHIAGIRRVG